MLPRREVRVLLLRPRGVGGGRGALLLRGAAEGRQLPVRPLRLAHLDGGSHPVPLAAGARGHRSVH